MDHNASRQQRREAQRLRLLKSVYDLNHGSVTSSTTITVAFQWAELDRWDGDDALTYLVDEGLLEKDGAVSDFILIRITHSGIKEYEAVLRGNDSGGTDRFSPVVVHQIIQTVNAPVYGAVQAGGHHNVAKVKNVANEKNVSGARLREFAPLIARLRARSNMLPADARGQAREIILKVKAQAESDKPNTSIMKRYLEGLHTFAELAPIVRELLRLITGI